jgi:3-hydroxyisobutyrate dehydrogenase-like beta-hydroxyacid dehydrogenase
MALDDVSTGRVAVVGYGEVGRIFGAALLQAGVREVFAFDVLVTDARWATDARARAARDGVHLANDLAEAVAGAGLVISAVTAGATATAATQIAAVAGQGSFVLDLNSASPRTKKECADVVNRAGARYVEAGVMTSVPPHGIRTPMLLGGPHAEALAPTLARLGFDATVGSADYGVVSAIKLCRSVFIKGMEALAVEGLLTARRYGVEEKVLASLAETYPGMDWARQADYFWRRVVQHGRRRSEEMREAAVTVSDAGGSPHMAGATAEVQAWMAMLKSEGVFEGTGKDAGWRELADAIDAASVPSGKAVSR